jgi:hypothetical protein
VAHVYADERALLCRGQLFFTALHVEERLMLSLWLIRLPHGNKGKRPRTLQSRRHRRTHDGRGCDAAGRGAVGGAARAYLPPDGFDKDEFITRVLDATDNPRVNAALAAHGHPVTG